MTTEHDLAKAIADAVDAKVASMRPESSTMPATYQGRDSEGKGWVLLPGATEPTPVARMAVEAAQGDTVSVTVANGKATVNSNLSNPSAGLAGVQVVAKTADTANSNANTALVSATDAKNAAIFAQESSDTARQAAREATADAAIARTMAESASADAATASASAAIAKQSADKATFTLSDVENVVGTLNWIAEHGKYVPTSDTAIIEGKAYYRRIEGATEPYYWRTADKTAVYGKTYYSRSGDGTEASPYVYAAIALPDSNEYSEDALRIISHPRSCFALAIGEQVSFSVETNDAEASYVWYRATNSSAFPVSGAGSRTPDLGPVAVDEYNTLNSGYFYYCRVTFANGTTVNSGHAGIFVGPVYEGDDSVYEQVASPVISELSTYYELSISESVQNYLAAHLWLDDFGLNLSVDSANGYRIHQGTVDGTHEAGTHILDPQGTIVATFGANGFQVGTYSESHLIGDYHSLQLLDKEGNTYFHVSDLRDESGTLEQSTTAEMSYSVQDGEGNAVIYTNTPPIQTLKSVYYYTGEYPNREKHGITSSCSVDTLGRLIVPLSLEVPDGAVLYITYITASYLTKAYTLGIRSENYTVGLMSCAIGEDVKAQGRYAYAEGKGSEARAEAAHAEGYGTYATGYHSHAEGAHTSASGSDAHAEGEYSGASGAAAHAEGHHTVASGGDSHAEGSYSIASGGCSHAQNAYTIAASDDQTALGKFNVEDANDSYAVIVGNGTRDAARSNALTADWDGIVGAQNVGMYGTCDTAAATAAKFATLDDYGVTFKLVKGAVVRIYMANSNTVADPTLNVNNTGAKAIKRYGTTAPSTASGSSWIGGTVMTFLYDGTYWRLCDYRNNDNTVPSAYCSTAAATAAKVASCSGYALLSKSFLHVILTASNTAASALTFNVNGKGAKPIYINGTASSSSNYTLPAGSYLVYYNGTNYYFRTDGLLTANITGTASNVTGTVAIAHGGTGDTATTTTTTLSEICTKGTNITLESGSYSHWGKVASFSIVFKPTAAIASGATVFTLVSGKRPDLYSIGNDSSSTTPISINTSGAVVCRRALTSGTSYTFRATYLLA